MYSAEPKGKEKRTKSQAYPSTWQFGGMEN